MSDTHGVLHAFRATIAARGLEPSEIVADGQIQRCRVVGGKGGRLDGSYLLHLDEIPAGGFQNHRDGQGWETWRADVLAPQPSAAERRAEEKRRAEMRAARAADMSERQLAAAKRAEQIWRRCRPACGSHPYLLRKNVGAYGLRQLRDALVIPARDANGKLWTLEFIGPDGAKRFLTGGRKRGCYFAIGPLADVICVAEGYATAASIRMATGHAVAVAFDAGNLESVARALRGKFANARLVICADDDNETPGNPGMSRAAQAARAVGGLVAVPSFEVVA